MQNKKRLHKHLLMIYIIYFAALIVGFAASFVPDFSRGWRNAQNTLEMEIPQGGIRSYYVSAPVIRSAGEPIGIDNLPENITPTISRLDLKVTVDEAYTLGNAFKVMGNNSFCYLLMVITGLSYLTILVLIALIINSLRKSIRDEQPLRHSNILRTRAIGILILVGELSEAFMKYLNNNEAVRLLTQAKLRHQFTVVTAANGRETLDILNRQHVDLIVADVMMPVMDGYQLVRTLRAEGNEIPVLFLTALQSMDSKREGFSSGIDDYLTKPVDYKELIWRIQALLRRAHIASEQQILVGNTRLDSASYTVTCRGQTLELPKKEFDLLYKLLSYPGQIFTRSQLLDDVWGYVSESGEDTVKTHISRLRNWLKDVDDFQIITIKGLGYKAELVKEKEQ